MHTVAKLGLISIELQKATALRDGADEDALPVLDGVHVDKRGDDVLPAAARLQQADLRPRGLHLHARLGQHGRLHHNPIDTRARPVGHHNRLHLHLHILDDEETEIRRADTRQGVRHRPIREPEQSQPHHVVRTRDDVLDGVGALRRP